MTRGQRIDVDKKVLVDWVKKQKWDYVQLAFETGMSATLAYRLLQGYTVGNSAIAMLAPLNIPGLFYLLTQDGKKVPVEIKVL